MVHLYGCFRLRSKKEYKTIIVSKQVFDRIQEDKKHFESLIGGGKWSNNDTITEYIKILNIFKEQDTNK